MQDYLEQFLVDNRHVVDRLYKVRQLKREIAGFEAEILAEIGRAMGASDHLGGEECIASRRISKRKGGLDKAKLEKKVGKLDAYRKPTSLVTTIVVAQRAEE